MKKEAVISIRGEWISVKDAVPEDNREVIVALKINRGYSVTTGLHYDNWVAINGEDFAWPVTHWQYLPKPPKKISQRTK